MTLANGTTATRVPSRKFQVYTSKHLDGLLARAGLSERERLAARAVATVLPFRTNNYVVDELIDWNAAPDDPIYRLTFPQEDMLPEDEVAHLADLLRRKAPSRSRTVPPTGCGPGSTRIPRASSS